MKVISAMGIVAVGFCVFLGGVWAMGEKVAVPAVKPSRIVVDTSAKTISNSRRFDLKMAPDFTLPNAKGEAISLSGFKGKHVVLEWTNHQCPFVKKHYGSKNMQDLQKTYTQKDVIWLSIVSSAPGRQGHVTGPLAAELTTKRGAAPSHVLLDSDGSVGKLYQAKTTPHIFIIDKEGQLVYQGAIDSIGSANAADITHAKNYVKASLDALLAGQPVSVGYTRSYGCSVKY
ncbi:MAG: peroxiredoxin [Candidatus Marinamargulisbacteria bacterium]|jgi:peroxiredoxin